MSQKALKQTTNNLRGMALVSVLITLAVVSALTVQTVKKQSQQQQLFALQLQERQLWQQALGAEALAKQLLLADLQTPASKASDRFGEVWDIGSNPTAESASSLIRIRDAQGKLNPNSMLVEGGKIDPRRLQLFQQAAAIEDVEPALIAELAEWIDADDELRLGGRESSLWRRVSPPNAPMVSRDEIRLLPSYASTFVLPAAFWQPLPEPTSININTASRGVIQRLRPGITDAQLNTIVGRQRNGGYASKAAFLNAAEGRGFGNIAELIDVRSSWFLVQVELEWGQGLMVFESLLHREAERGQVRTQYRHWRAAAPTMRN